MDIGHIRDIDFHFFNREVGQIRRFYFRHSRRCFSGIDQCCRR
jgi:hypothetical protein